MDKFRLDLEYCFGIRKLSHEFDFTKHPKNLGMPFVVYAPNGSMKSSLANTLECYANDAKVKNKDGKLTSAKDGNGDLRLDMMIPAHKSKMNVTNEIGTPIDKNSILVFKSFDETYQSDKISSLLVNEKRKKEYDIIFNNIANKRDALIKELKSSVGISKDIEKTISGAFRQPETRLLPTLARYEREVKKQEYIEFAEIRYNDIFNKDTEKLFDDPEIQKLIGDYTELYNKILDDSQFFKRGVFNHSNAETIAKNLESNGWFKGGHKVILVDKSIGTTKEIDNKSDLVDAIEAEKQRILEDENLGQMFNRMESKITNVASRTLRDLLLNNPSIVPELQDTALLKERLWIGYLSKAQSTYLDLIEEFDKNETRIDEIIKQAESEQTAWEEVVALYKSRFDVPFRINVSNKSDAILNLKAPNLSFEFKDEFSGTYVPTNEIALKNVLSTGEKRAFYILNIIFELKARQKNETQTILILDDIADSFDYKNKYAIIEYLKDYCDNPLFKMIILTHNFDFYRTVRSRLSVYGDNKLIASRSSDGIKLVEIPLNQNPFQDDWKDKLDNLVTLIAGIPFVRNLTEYTGQSSEEKNLTSLLHQKSESEKITFKKLKEIFQNVMREIDFDKMPDSDDSVFNKMPEAFKEIASRDNDNLDLADKISIAIGIRLLAEKIMIDKINDTSFTESIKKYQTSNLFKKYKTCSNIDTDEMLLLQKVMLFTPEHIHVNSFMYEPILDMSGWHLQKLYNDLEKISDNSPQE